MLQLYEEYLGSLPYLCTKNEVMAPLYVATLTVKRELPKHETTFSILPYLCTKNETMAPLHVATHQWALNFNDMTLNIILILSEIQKNLSNTSGRTSKRLLYYTSSLIIPPSSVFSVPPSLSLSSLSSSFLHALLLSPPSLSLQRINSDPLTSQQQLLLLKFLLGNSVLFVDILLIIITVLASAKIIMSSTHIHR